MTAAARIPLAEPTALEFAGVRVVLPAGRGGPNRKEWADIFLAAAANDCGQPAMRDMIIARLERDLGVSQRDRYIADQGAQPDSEAMRTYTPVRAAQQSIRRTAFDQRDRARASTILDDAEFTAEELAALDRANAARDLAAQYAQEAEQARAAGRAPPHRRKEVSALLAESRRIYAEVKRGRAERTQMNYESRIAVERKAQAASRGEEIVTETVEAMMLVPLSGVLEGAYAYREQRITRLRNTARDGLALLRDGGKINQVAWAAGMRYRRLYEDCREPLGSHMRHGDGGGQGDRDSALSGRIQARPLLDEAERAVKARGPCRALALGMLRAVAGRGENLQALAPEPGQRGPRMAALTTALSDLADHWGIR